MVLHDLKIRHSHELESETVLVNARWGLIR